MIRKPSILVANRIEMREYQDPNVNHGTSASFDVEEVRAFTSGRNAMVSRRVFIQSTALCAANIASGSWPARAAYLPGISDTEIKFGQSMPYSGPASSYSTIGRAEAAYFKMINDMGGVNNRKLNFVSVDDGYTAPKTVEQTRRLVEEEHVAFIFGTLGGFTNVAIRAYLNENKEPQLFCATAAAGPWRHREATSSHSLLLRSARSRPN